MAAFAKRVAIKIRKAAWSNAAMASIIALCVAVAGYTVSASFAATGPSLYLQPASGTYEPGKTITVTIKANTAGNNVNAVQADLTYSANRLQFTGINASGSAFSIDASSSGGNGNISIARGSISNVSGDVLVAKVSFKTLNDLGSANVNFSGSSALIRSSDNNNILSSTSGGNFTIKTTSSGSSDSSGSSSKPKESTATQPKYSPKSTASTSQDPETNSVAPDDPTLSGVEISDVESPAAAMPDNYFEADGQDTTYEENNSAYSGIVFFGLSGGSAAAVGLGLPVVLAVLAAGAIYWRHHRQLALLQSGHNFNLNTSVSDVQSPPPTTVTPSSSPQQQQPPSQPQAPQAPDTVIRPTEEQQPQDKTPGQ